MNIKKREWDNLNNRHVKIHILSGAPASGKSTYATKRTQESSRWERISSDDIRSDLLNGESESDIAKHERNRINKIVFQEMYNKLICISKDQKTTDIIYDSTNLNLKRRKVLYENIKRDFRKMGIDSEVIIEVFHAPLHELLRRNSLRDSNSVVPDEVLYQMYIGQQPPFLGLDCDSYKYHGESYFKNVSLLRSPTLGHAVKQLETSEIYHEISPILGMKHHCEPHHYETIEEHINMVYKNTIKLIRSDESVLIAYLHDLGKPISKVQSKETGRARYIGHSNISAMYTFVYSQENRDHKKINYEHIGKVVLLHMTAHTGISSKTIKRYQLDEAVLSMLNNFSYIDSISRVVEI